MTGSLRWAAIAVAAAVDLYLIAGGLAVGRPVLAVVGLVALAWTLYFIRRSRRRD